METDRSAVDVDHKGVPIVDAAGCLPMDLGARSDNANPNVTLRALRCIRGEG